VIGAAICWLVIALPAPAAELRSRSSALGAAIVLQMNAVRAQAGLRPLRFNDELITAARSHSLEMASRGYFSHDSADGESMADRVRASYVVRRRWTVGENLLWWSPRVGGAHAVSLWMASPEHRAIILTAGFEDVGCASVHAPTAPGVFDGLPVTVVTCDFGVRS
jgi:uncharacterized protein YkwD